MIITLDVDYYIKEYRDILRDEFHVIAKTGWKKFYYDKFDRGDFSFNDEPVNIPEGHIPKFPSSNRISIELPRPWYHTEVPEFVYRAEKPMIDGWLLDHIDREMRIYLDEQSEIHKLPKIEIKWHRIDPPKI